MAQVEKHVTKFQDFLQQQGLKLTSERTALIREIFSTHYHFEADELLFKMKEKNVKISRATIYRTLELLVDSGIVGRVRIGEIGYRYERLRAGEHHDHLICNECGRVIEFFEPRIESLQDEVCDRYGFLSISHSHQMRGICRQCRPRALRPEAAATAVPPAKTSGRRTPLIH